MEDYLKMMEDDQDDSRLVTRFNQKVIESVAQYFTGNWKQPGRLWKMTWVIMEDDLEDD